jgi:hypothetical protein
MPNKRGSVISARVPTSSRRRACNTSSNERPFTRFIE